MVRQIYVSAVLVSLLCACTHQVSDSSDMASAQSWDQENLKRYDVGCPTAVFIAPDGNLEQCP